MTEDEVRAVWLYAAEVWPNYPLPEDETAETIRMQAWMRNLADLPLRTVQAAVDSLSTRDHPPKVGQVRVEAMRLTRAAAGIDEPPDVDEAWAEVMREVHRVGRAGKPEWTHPVVTETVRTVGWIELCNATNVDVIRGQFSRFYTAARDRHQQEATPPGPAVAAIIGRRQEIGSGR